jgi:hypothetical protein
MKKQTPPLPGGIQVKVYQTLEQLGTGTVKKIAQVSGLTEAQVSGAVDTFIEKNKAYICEWSFESSHSSARVIKLGRGDNVPRWKTSKGQDKIPKGDMHLLDYRQQHLEHQKFMQNFKPHPDVAAAWLLNPIQGESA